VILDVNEFRPIFQHRDIQLKLAEDTAVGSVIAMATATDGDAKNGPGLRFAEVRDTGLLQAASCGLHG